MRFEVWFTIEATDEAARMSRGWTYWPVFVFQDLYGVMRHRDIRTATRVLAAINPLILTFDGDGLHTLEKSGARNFVLWAGYDGFREGSRVILLRETGTREFSVIPKNTEPHGDVEQLRSAVRSRLPEIR